MARKGIYCDTNCWWKWTGKNCEIKRNCICQACSGLDAIDMGVYESCRLACQSDNVASHPKSQKQYMCQELGAAQAFTRYGYTCDGFNPLTDTAEGQLLDKNNQATQQSSKTMRLYAGVALAVFAVVVLLSFLPKTKTALK